MVTPAHRKHYVHFGTKVLLQMVEKDKQDKLDAAVKKDSAHSKAEALAPTTHTAAAAAAAAAAASASQSASRPQQPPSGQSITAFPPLQPTAASSTTSSASLAAFPPLQSSASSSSAAGVSFSKVASFPQKEEHPHPAKHAETRPKQEQKQKHSHPPQALSGPRPEEHSQSSSAQARASAEPMPQERPQTPQYFGLEYMTGMFPCSPSRFPCPLTALPRSRGSVEKCGLAVRPRRI